MLSHRRDRRACCSSDALLGAFPIGSPTCSSRKTDGPEYLKKKKNVEKRRGIIFLKFIKGTEGFFNTDQPIPVAKFYKIPGENHRLAQASAKAEMDWLLQLEMGQRNGMEFIKR
jgi:hypothetical protein